LVCYLLSLRKLGVMRPCGWPVILCLFKLEWLIFKRITSHASFSLKGINKVDNFEHMIPGRKSHFNCWDRRLKLSAGDVCRASALCCEVEKTQWLCQQGYFWGNQASILHNYHPQQTIPLSFSLTRQQNWQCSCFRAKLHLNQHIYKLASLAKLNFRNTVRIISVLT